MLLPKIDLAPLILIKSGEPVYGERALDDLRRRIRVAAPDAVITAIDVSQYNSGQLAMLTSPSLFGEQRAIVVPDLEKLNTAFQSDLLAYMSSPEPDIWMILKHNGGVRGKKILDACARAKVPTVAIGKVANKDRPSVVTDEVKSAKRAIAPEAVHALVDAVGSDVRELLSATDQLLADVQGKIDESDVHRYFAGRIEATGFNVADAVVAGNTGQAVELLRHAQHTGAVPVMIVTALASKFRTMAQIIGLRSNAIPVDLQLNSWVADKAQRSLRVWSQRAIGVAICEIAQADYDVKGGSRDPWYSIERAILAIGKARHLR
ncbi:MAG: DNA polymerase III subunit delta [Actinomycetaceae bacterium]|nr:DNA polymerase III subunit delta [Arcanobacterium sp.]MDD7505253.1 DNA polymerase III subunit delta [Actinomycetaceae bacterium]MDY6144016.1 DNA polymerase III subunit delta [Arcanobacterium sp.]